MWEKLVSILNPHKALKKVLHKVNNNKKKKADIIRSMTDEELARYIAATQISTTKEVCSMLGLVFEETDDMLKDATQEILVDIQQFMEV